MNVQRQLTHVTIMPHASILMAAITVCVTVDSLEVVAVVQVRCYVHSYHNIILFQIVCHNSATHEELQQNTLAEF